MLTLYRLLCRYYWDINPHATANYIDFNKEKLVAYFIFQPSRTSRVASVLGLDIQNKFYQNLAQISTNLHSKILWLDMKV